MNIPIIIQPNIIPRIYYQLLTIISVLFLSFMLSAIVMAGEQVTYDGTLQGASCVHYEQKCPEDDAHIAMENDFVLILPNNDHYFLPNLNRAIKARYVGKTVRISGDKEGESIWVAKLQSKKGGDKYTTVWSWKGQLELYKGGGGQ